MKDIGYESVEERCPQKHLLLVKPGKFCRAFLWVYFYLLNFFYEKQYKNNRGTERSDPH